MQPTKAILLGLASTASIMGGIDASELNEQPIDRVEMVANERVEAKQIGNVIETTLPWKDQPGIKVSYDLGEPTMAERFADKRKKEVITETVTDFEGGFKVDILLNEKPDTNVFCYDIEGAENYDFFYQPPLTPEEIEEGASRPPEIEGSYAVYHKTLANHILGQENYATGKVLHIPRPQVWELENKEATTEWADLSYTEQDGLCVTVPQDFLDTATYPVRVDPTFGYTSSGASGFNIAYYAFGAGSVRVGGWSNLGAAGTLDSISARLKANAVTQTIDIHAGLYREDSAGANSHDLVAGIERTSVAVTTSAAWFDFTAASESLTADDYIISVLGDGNDMGTTNFRDVSLMYDASIGQRKYSQDYATNYSTGKSENPWANTDSVTIQLFSIYATYTEVPSFNTSTTRGGVNIKGGGTIR